MTFHSHWTVSPYYPLLHLSFIPSDSPLLRFASTEFDPAKVDRFATCMYTGDSYPAVTATVYPDSIIEIVDGGHRTRAAQLIGWPDIAYVCPVPSKYPYKRSGPWARS